MVLPLFNISFQFLSVQLKPCQMICWLLSSNLSIPLGSIKAHAGFAAMNIF